MYMSHTYGLACTVREKFQNQAAAKDHNLRVLVAHANLYDNLLQVLHQDQQIPEEKVDEVDPRVVHIENVARERRQQNIKRAASTTHLRHTAGPAATSETDMKKSPIAIPAGRNNQSRERYATVAVDEVELDDEDEEFSDDDSSEELDASAPGVYYESDSESDSDWDEEDFYDECDDLDDCDCDCPTYTHEAMLLQIAKDLEVSKLEHC